MGQDNIECSEKAIGKFMDSEKFDWEDLFLRCGVVYIAVGLSVVVALGVVAVYIWKWRSAEAQSQSSANHESDDTEKAGSFCRDSQDTDADVTAVGSSASSDSSVSIGEVESDANDGYVGTLRSRRESSNTQDSDVESVSDVIVASFASRESSADSVALDLEALSSETDSTPPKEISPPRRIAFRVCKYVCVLVMFVNSAIPIVLYCMTKDPNLSENLNNDGKFRDCPELRVARDPLWKLADVGPAPGWKYNTRFGRRTEQQYASLHNFFRDAINRQSYTEINDIAVWTNKVFLKKFFAAKGLEFARSHFESIEHDFNLVERKIEEMMASGKKFVVKTANLSWNVGVFILEGRKLIAEVNFKQLFRSMNSGFDESILKFGEYWDADSNFPLGLYGNFHPKKKVVIPKDTLLTAGEITRALRYLTSLRPMWEETVGEYLTPSGVLIEELREAWDARVTVALGHGMGMSRDNTDYCEEVMGVEKCTEAQQSTIKNKFVEVAEAVAKAGGFDLIRVDVAVQRVGPNEIETSGRIDNTEYRVVVAEVSLNAGINFIRRVMTEADFNYIWCWHANLSGKEKNKMYEVDDPNVDVLSALKLYNSEGKLITSGDILLGPPSAKIVEKLGNIAKFNSEKLFGDIWRDVRKTESWFLDLQGYASAVSNRIVQLDLEQLEHSAKFLSKIESKQVVRGCGVPVLEGCEEFKSEDLDRAALRNAIEKKMKSNEAFVLKLSHLHNKEAIFVLQNDVLLRDVTFFNARYSLEREGLKASSRLPVHDEFSLRAGEKVSVDELVSVVENYLKVL